MKTLNEIFIHAEPMSIYNIAVDTVNWPNILPHYRFVHCIENAGDTRLVHMGARRDFIPVQWTARQENVPEIPEIRFTHVKGWTRGMDVVWRFTREPDGTRVVIEHELTFRFPFAARWIGEHIIGSFFVHAIAGRTLARMKQLAEAS